MTAPTATRLTGKALGEAVLDVVENHPELHDQTFVTCDTTACIAGWTLALHHGARPGERLDPPLVEQLPQDEAFELIFGDRFFGDGDEFTRLYQDWQDAVYFEGSEARAVAAFRDLLDEYAEE